MSAAEYCKGSGAANAFDKYNAPKTGIAAGLAKGHKVTTKKAKRGTRSRALRKSERVATAKAIAREIVGLAPYEKRLLLMVNAGS